MSTQETCSVFSAPWCRRYASTALLSVVGVAISLSVFYTAYFWERRSIRREFDSLAEDRFHAISNKVDDSASLLHFADNVLLVGPRSDSHEFSHYVSSLAAVLKADLSRYPAVRSMIWMPRVSNSERAAYERAARTAFDPTFQFKEPGTSADAGSGRLLEEDFPSFLCIATKPNSDQSCKNSARDAADWKVMQRAIDTGLTFASPPISLSSGSKGPLGYRLFQPLYQGDAGDIASRRQSITGFLCVDLDICESVAKAFKNISPVGIDVWVYDDTDAEDVNICRHTSRLNSSLIDGGEQGVGNELESTSTMEFFGRKLVLRCCSTPAFWGGRTIWQPWVLLCVGLALTLTGAGYRLSLAFHAAAIEQTVAMRIAAVCQDFEQRQKAKQSSEPTSPPAENEKPELK